MLSGSWENFNLIRFISMKPGRAVKATIGEISLGTACGILAKAPERFSEGIDGEITKAHPRGNLK